MKKIGFPILALILVLGTMGVGYSMWSQSINLTGTVTTANVLVGIRVPSGFSYMDPPPNGVTPPGVIVNPNGSTTGTKDPRVAPFTTPPTTFAQLVHITPDKNVASVDELNNGTFRFWGDFTRNLPDRIYYDSVTENITNAYPFYAPAMPLSICNGGILPIKISSFTVTDPDNILSTVRFYWSLTLSKASGPVQLGTGCGTLSDLGTALHGIQVEKGEQIYITLYMLFLQNTPQNTSGNFSMIITAAQWNEVS